MAKVSTSTARKDFSDLVNRAAYGKERVILTRRGKILAALIPAEDLDLLEKLEDQLDAEDAKKALRKFRRSGGPAIPWEKVKKNLDL